jgi:hypothetical protein
MSSGMAKCRDAAAVRNTAVWRFPMAVAAYAFCLLSPSREKREYEEAE